MLPKDQIRIVIVESMIERDCNLLEIIKSNEEKFFT